MDYFKIIKGVFLAMVFLSVIFFGLQEGWQAAKDNNLFFTASVSGKSEMSEPIEAVFLPPKPYRNWDIPELDLLAESGLAMEGSLSGKNKVLYKKNSEVKLPIASITKLMTAVISLEKYSLDYNVLITEKAANVEGGQKLFSEGGSVSVNDLLYMILIESNNKAALALSEGMDSFEFIRLMNQKARELGMDDSFFAEPTGLDPLNVSTAEDIAKLAKYILREHPEIAEISRIKEHNLQGYGVLVNTDQLLGEIPEIILGKTGFTLEARGCLFLVLKSNNKDEYFIFVTLGADERFVEMKRMIEWVNKAYIW